MREVYYIRICKRKLEMNSLTVLGKYLDQPRFIKNFSHAVPAILIASGGGLVLNNVIKAPKENRKKETVKNICVIGATVISAIFAPKIASKIVREHNHENIEDISKVIADFLINNKLSIDTSNILKKAKKEHLGYSDIKIIFKELGGKEEGKEFLNKLIPEPENIDSKHIFGEIGKLSVLGAIPVLGGITGGIAGDKLTDKNWEKKISDKIKEGSYQYLANIFLCNIGAGVALLAMEKLNIKSKQARAIGMIGGIILTGVVLGSAIANGISEKIIDPIIHKKHNKKGLYSERTPELLDISLHVDDVATVAVLSGLKWIEPSLPILYSISGYRAGIGYRNGDK
jgi:hypothetical protein